MNFQNKDTLYETFYLAILLCYKVPDIRTTASAAAVSIGGGGSGGGILEGVVCVLLLRDILVS